MFRPKAGTLSRILGGTILIAFTFSTPSLADQPNPPPRDHPAIEWIRERNAFGVKTPIVNDVAQLVNKDLGHFQSQRFTFGPRLMKSGKPEMLIIWSGQVLSVEITPEHAKLLELQPRGMTYAHGSQPPDKRAATSVAIAAPQLGRKNAITAAEPFSGQLDYKIKEPLLKTVAVRLTYFNGSETTSLFHYPKHYLIKDDTLTFEFDKLDANVPEGPLVVVLDICATQRNSADVTVVSNAVAKVVNVRTPPKP